MTKALDKAPGFTAYDYGFLKGDTEMWPRWGAAMSVVMEYCKNLGLGNFGEPTELGVKVMREYDEITYSLT